MPTRTPPPGRRSIIESAVPSPLSPVSSTSGLVMRQRGEEAGPSGVKRKRTDHAAAESSGSRTRTTNPQQASDHELPDDGDFDVYDPDQPPEERRELQRGFRDLLREVTENSEELLQGPSDGIQQTIRRANELTKQVRQTGEASIDSRLLVTTTDLSYRKALRLTQGSLSQGIDVDEFVSKCIAYMRTAQGIDDNGSESNDARVRRRQSSYREEDDDEGDEGDMMNWPHLGRFACLPSIRRPALPGFLLGPLSVERKVRRIARRNAPLQRHNLTETRPEVLRVEDLAKTENEMTALCSKILERLKSLQKDIQRKLNQILQDVADEKEQERIMHHHGLRSTGGIDLMRFVVNPRSFGQTVENLFYVSFLIKDGYVEIAYDESGLPALAPVEPNAEHAGVKSQGAAKYQAILTMDMAIWREIISTFKLEQEEPMIEHRPEANNSGPGASSWYS